MERWPTNLAYPRIRAFPQCRTLGNKAKTAITQLDDGLSVVTILCHCYKHSPVSSKVTCLEWPWTLNLMPHLRWLSAFLPSYAPCPASTDWTFWNPLLPFKSPLYLHSYPQILDAGTQQFPANSPYWWKLTKRMSSYLPSPTLHGLNQEPVLFRAHMKKPFSSCIIQKYLEISALSKSLCVCIYMCIWLFECERE